MRRLFLILLCCWFLATPLGWGAASRNFDGATNDRVDFGDVTFFDGSTSLSISLWLYLDANTNGRLISKWGNLTEEQSFLLQLVGSGDEIEIDLGRGLTYCLKPTSASNLTTGVWYHVLGVWTSGCTVTIYINGISQSLATGTNGSVSSVEGSATTMQIGHETDETVDGAEGNYGWIGIWKIALTQRDATMLANGMPPYLVGNSLPDMCPPVLGDATEIDWCSTTTGTVTGTTVTSNGPPVYLSSPLAKVWNRIMKYVIVASPYRRNFTRWGNG